jgi:hypothetical protein
MEGMQERFLSICLEGSFTKQGRRNTIFGRRKGKPEQQMERGRRVVGRTV